MNYYEEKLEARRERYQARAEAAQVEAGRRFKAGDLREEVSGIPMGQPVLIGHHSEKRHRAALKRADNSIRKGIEARKKADYYASKASSVGKGGISSDDPEAVTKLKAKIAKADGTRAQYKKLNAMWKRHKGDPAKVAVAMEMSLASMEKVKETLDADPYLSRTGKPIESFQITSLSANIRRMKKRLEVLDAAADEPEREDIYGPGFRIEEDKDENRIRFHFDARPDKETCRKMKSAGFRFSRANTAWQRHLNNSGRHAAYRMAKELFSYDV